MTKAIGHGFSRLVTQEGRRGHLEPGRDRPASSSQARRHGLPRLPAAARAHQPVARSAQPAAAAAARRRAHRVLDRRGHPRPRGRRARSTSASPSIGIALVLMLFFIGLSNDRRRPRRPESRPRWASRSHPSWSASIPSWPRPRAPRSPRSRGRCSPRARVRPAPLPVAHGAAGAPRRSLRGAGIALAFVARRCGGDRGRAAPTCSSERTTARRSRPSRRPAAPSVRPRQA